MNIFWVKNTKRFNNSVLMLEKNIDYLNIMMKMEMIFFLFKNCKINLDKVYK